MSNEQLLARIELRPEWSTGFKLSIPIAVALVVLANMLFWAVLWPIGVVENVEGFGDLFTRASIGSIFMIGVAIGIGISTAQLSNSFARWCGRALLQRHQITYVQWITRAKERFLQHPKITHSITCEIRFLPYGGTVLLCFENFIDGHGMIHVRQIPYVIKSRDDSDQICVKSFAVSAKRSHHIELAISRFIKARYRAIPSGTIDGMPCKVDYFDRNQFNMTHKGSRIMQLDGLQSRRSDIFDTCDCNCFAQSDRI